jgi:hypothetical protein
MSQRSTELARQFEQAVAQFDKTVEGCTDAQWGAVSSAEGWTVAQLAEHVSGQFVNEMMFITAGAEGRPLPPITLEQLNEMNESRAEKNRGVTKAEVLEVLRSEAPSIADYIRALSDEQLDRTSSLAMAGGASVSTQQLLEGGVLIAHLTEHTESIRSATAPLTASRL